MAPITGMLTTVLQPLNMSVHSRMPTVSSGALLPSRSIAAAVYSCLLRICYLVTNVVPLSFSRPLPRNKCCFRAVLALSKYAIIFNSISVLSSVAEYVLGSPEIFTWSTNASFIELRYSLRCSQYSENGPYYVPD
jgi:hypothetical protein